MAYNETLAPDLVALVDKWSAQYFIQFDPDAKGFVPSFTLAELQEFIGYLTGNLEGGHEVRFPLPPGYGSPYPYPLAF